MKSLYATLTFAAVALGSGIAHSADAGKSVRLQFKWPNGFTAHVDASLVHEVDGQEDWRAGLKYDLLAENDGPNLRVRIKNRAMSGASTDAAGARDWRVRLPDHLQQSVLLALSDFSITHGGSFMRIEPRDEELATLRAELRPTMRPWLSELSDERFEKFLGSVASARAVTTKTYVMWRDLAEMWSSGELVTGESHTLEETPLLHQFAIHQMRMAGQFSATELTACSRGGKSRQCAVIELHEGITNEERQKLLALLAPSSTDKEILTDVNLTKTLRVVLEPNGVMPHSFARTIEFTPVTKRGEAREEHRIAWIDSASYSYP